jgi:hypothetical protein
VSCLQETDMVQRRIRLPFVVTVTVQGLCSVQREKLGAANMRDFVRLCELSKSIHCRRGWFVCLFVCFGLFCFVARTLVTSSRQRFTVFIYPTLLKNDVHLHDKISLEYHNFKYININKRK